MAVICQNPYQYSIAKIKMKKKILTCLEEDDFANAVLHEAQYILSRSDPWKFLFTMVTFSPDLLLCKSISVHFCLQNKVKSPLLFCNSMTSTSSLCCVNTWCLLWSEFSMRSHFEKKGHGRTERSETNIRRFDIKYMSWGNSNSLVYIEILFTYLQESHVVFSLTQQRNCKSKD